MIPTVRTPPRGLALAAALLLIAAPLLAATPPPAPPAAPAAAAPQAPPEPPEPPVLSARGYILIDQASGHELAGLNADQPLEPASLTKIMTAYVIFGELAAGHIGMEDQVLVSEKAWRTGGSKMFVPINSHIAVKDLLLGIIVQSGNDACVAMAEHIAGTEEAFVQLMNDHAARLGMTSSHFVNASGLPDPQLYTTPRDMARLARALIADFPQYYPLYSTLEYTFNNIKQYNRNRLLRLDPSVDGIKTGHTETAGYCLVSSAKRDDQRLVAVVMGTPSEKVRASDSLALLNWGFHFYETHQLFPGGVAVEQLRVWSGDPTSVPVGPLTDLAVTIPRGRYGELTAQLEPVDPLNAPLARGDVVGDIVVMLGDQEVQRQPAVALQDVPQGNLLRRAADAVLRLF